MRSLIEEDLASCGKKAISGFASSDMAGMYEGSGSVATNQETRALETEAMKEIADARLVRMSGLHFKCRSWTVDRNDFSTCRRMGRRTIPCESPPEL